MNSIHEVYVFTGSVHFDFAFGHNVAENPTKHVKKKQDSNVE